MDPLAGIAGACVISSWSFGLIRDTGAILLDMNPDRRMADNLKRSIEDDGDQLTGRRLPQRPRSADRTRSPVAVSQKREYFQYWPETIGCSGPEVANTRASSIMSASRLARRLLFYVSRGWTRFFLVARDPVP
jgi:hypothetical protein